jgi:hypothetical protein
MSPVQRLWCTLTPRARGNAVRPVFPWCFLSGRCPSTLGTSCSPMHTCRAKSAGAHPQTRGPVCRSRCSTHDRLASKCTASAAECSWHHVVRTRLFAASKSQSDTGRSCRDFHGCADAHMDNGKLACTGAEPARRSADYHHEEEPWQTNQVDSAHRFGLTQWQAQWR